MSYTNQEFNPSGSDAVAEIKAAAENLSVVIERLAVQPELKAKALIDVQSASMFAVKSLFSS
tara:strand:- start:39 stop:224 length:186 start_codon:yes stop_codon:yes gene_type:complete